MKKSDFTAEITLTCASNYQAHKRNTMARPTAPCIHLICMDSFFSLFLLFVRHTRCAGLLRLVQQSIDRCVYLFTYNVHDHGIVTSNNSSCFIFKLKSNAIHRHSHKCTKRNGSGCDIMTQTINKICVCTMYAYIHLVRQANHPMNHVLSSGVFPSSSHLLVVCMPELTVTCDTSNTFQSARCCSMIYLAFSSKNELIRDTGADAEHKIALHIKHTHKGMSV